MNSHRTKSFTTIVLALIGASLLAPSPSSATVEPVWEDGIAAVFGDGVPNVEYGPAGEVKSVSCASVGYCAAVGDFMNASGQLEAFVMTLTDGEWSNATPVLFPEVVGSRGFEDVLNSVSCWSPGDCTAVGRFYNALNRYQSFFVSSSDGVWGTAQLVENSFGNYHSGLSSVSCSTAGDCTAVGNFENGGGQVPIVARIAGGTWSTPVAVDFPSGTVPPQYYAQLKKVSCSSPGNCTAVGWYYEPDRDYQGFTVSSVDGVWSTARTVVFPPNTLNTRAEAEAVDVSCSMDGDCTAIGYFVDTTGSYRGFTVSSSSGVWSTAHALDTGSGLYSVSCMSTGNCVAVGDVYADGNTYAIRLASVNGVWGQTQLVSFPAVAQNSTTTSLYKVFCGSPGSCTAIGFFRNTDGADEAFTTTSVNGVWSTARPVVYATGSGSSRRPGSIKDLSCSSGGLCTVGGRFNSSSGRDEIFVMSSNEAPPATTTLPATTLPTSSTVAPSTTLPPPALDTVRALPPAPTPIVADNSIDAGEAITVSFGGFTPFEFVQLVVASTPQVIGSGYANAQGVVTLSGNLPANLAAGAHTLAVYAPGSGVGFTQSITVTALTLPTTGSSRGDGGAQVALWVLLAGIGAIVVARRRNA